MKESEDDFKPCERGHTPCMPDVESEVDRDMDGWNWTVDAKCPECGHEVWAKDAGEVVDMYEAMGQVRAWWNES